MESLTLTYKLLTLGAFFLCSAAICNETANQFERYRNGVCPTGTTWDKAVGCCTGCPVCGPGFKKGPDCKGPCQQCPVNFYSDKYDNTECYPCTECQTFKRTTKSKCFPTRNAICGEYLEGFKSIQGKCNENLNQFDTYSSGVCPTGTSWQESLGCCTGCPVCGPGFRKAPDCKGPCQPCPVNFYSNKYDNSECLPCTDCAALKRKQKHRCLPTKDATCRHCFKGFWEHPDLLSLPVRWQVSCLGCTDVLPSGGEVGKACNIRKKHRREAGFDPKLTLRISKYQNRTHLNLPKSVKRMLGKILKPRNATFTRADWQSQDVLKVQLNSELDVKNVLNHVDRVKSRDGKTIRIDSEASTPNEHK